MANRSILYTAAMVFTFTSAIPAAMARPRSSGRANAVNSASGLRTDRLTSKQLRIWREIELIAHAADKAGQPLHPTLNSLWQRVQSSGHTVFVEMKEPRAFNNQAGTTTLQKANSDGNRKVIVIWLHLWGIDNALVNPTVRRSDGLIPFQMLGKYERYAEALGHELAHAALMLENPEYERLCSEYGSGSVNLATSRKRDGNAADNKEETEQRLRRLQSLVDKIEKPAEAAESEIWRELLNGQRMEHLPLSF
jgi:hypothetical protein